MPQTHKDKRKFDASFSVRIAHGGVRPSGTPQSAQGQSPIADYMGTKRLRCELSPATLHGGSEGLYRVRIDRRWYDSPEGENLFLTREQIASLVVDLSLNALEPLAPCPDDFRKYTRCSVTFAVKGKNVTTQCTVMSPPIRGFDGRYYVFVQAGTYGRLFAPADNITVRVI